MQDIPGQRCTTSPPLPFTNLSGSPPPIEDTRLYHHPTSLTNVFVTVHGSRGDSGDSGHHYVLASHDGGGSWNFLRVDDQPPTSTAEQQVGWLLAADPQAPNIFWVQVARNRRGGGGRHRKLLRSNDGGQTWQQVPVDRIGGGEWTTREPARSLHVHPEGGDTLSLGYSIGHYQNGRVLTDGQQGNTPVIQLISAPDTHLGFRWLMASRTAEPAWRVGWEIRHFDARAIRTGDLPLMPYIAEACTTPIPAGADLAHRYVAGRWPIRQGWQLRDEAGKTSAYGIGRSPRAPTPSKTSPPTGQPRQLLPYLDWLGTVEKIHCHPDRYDVLVGGEGSWQGGVTGFDRGGWRLFHPDSSSTPFAGDLHLRQISVSRRQPDRVWLTSQPHVYRSNDYAATFTETTNPLFRHTMVHAHAADADVVYTDRSVSVDGGASWDVREIADSLRIQNWDRVVSHPANPAVIFSCASSGLRRWDDYLQRSTALAEGADYGHCRDIFVFERDTTRMWMGTDTGLWETRDAGQTWSRENRGLPNVPITRINMAHDEKEILVATFGRGLFTVPSEAVEPSRVSRAANAALPERGALLTNYPNPFTGETTVQFTTTLPVHVRLDVFDVLGRRVETVVDQRYGIGPHRVHWNNASLSRGVYLVRMLVDGRHVGARKLVRQ